MADLSLAGRLGHVFADPAWLRTALTHRSFGTPNNERLEFLGDGVLDFVVADLLFQRFPDLPEGDLSRLRASLVRQETLHQLALGLRLGDALRLGEGELRSGGASRPSILADALEASFGAVYVDGGFAAAQAVISRLFLPLIEGLPSGTAQKDPKTRLQEWLQARRRPTPRYILQDTEGAAHARWFTVTCDIANPPLSTRGQGSSRRHAEQAAAEAALKELES